MKNLLVYYLAIILPLPLIIWSASYSSSLFVILLFSYVIYRSFVDGQRLIRKGIINKNDLWKSFIPFWGMRFFKELYFEN
jgi:hypothetical protein